MSTEDKKNDSEKTESEKEESTKGSAKETKENSKNSAGTTYIYGFGPWIRTK